jgi:hypothetical protein
MHAQTAGFVGNQLKDFLVNGGKRFPANLGKISSEALNGTADLNEVRAVLSFSRLIASAS